MAAKLFHAPTIIYLINFCFFLNFAPWGYRGQSYLMGLVTGYLLYSTKDSDIQLDSRLNLVIWQLLAFTGLALIYGPYWLPGPVDEAAQYDFLYREIHRNFALIGRELHSARSLMP